MHLIQQHTIQVKTSSLKLGKEIHAQIGTLLESELYPKLEVLLDNYSKDKVLKKYDTINIHLPKIAAKNWKENLIEKTLDEIEKQLIISNKIERLEDQKKIVTNFSHFSKEEELKRLFLKYIQTGNLETNSFCTTLNELWNAVLLDNLFLGSLLDFIIKDITILKRWINNVPLKLHKKTLKILQVTSLPLQFEFFLVENNSIKIKLLSSNRLTKKQNHFNSKNIDFNEFLTLFNWYVLFFFKSKKNKSRSFNEFKITINKISFFNSETEVLNLLINRLEESSAFLKIEKEPIKESELIVKVKAQKISIIYIKNAGLIILFPFLLEFFSKLNLLEEKKFKSYKTQQRAVILLQYLLNGKEKFFENDLALNKLLCGLKITDYVNTDVVITETEKLESRNLLKTIIQHWKKLKNTSVSIFQSTFLAREAKLTINAKGNLALKIDQKGLDVLIDYLPWSISEIKTPWMEKSITCKWN